MFILTNEIKNKLVRDLKRDIRFKDHIFEFDGVVLYSHSDCNGTARIDFSDMPTNYSYTKLLKGTQLYLVGVRKAYLSIKNSLETISYKDFIKKVKAVKYDIPPADNGVSYAVNGKGASRKPYSLSTKAYVMIPDEKTVDHAKELIEQVKNGYVPEP
jgi:hypothetical protein